MSLGLQVAWLLVLAVPVAAVSWTVTHEEIFREPREYFARRARNDRTWYTRKFFYALLCEYCFSHYVALFFIALADFRMLLADWRGYTVAWFALVWVANLYMSLYARLRVDIKKERTEIEAIEKAVEEKAERRPGKNRKDREAA